MKESAEMMSARKTQGESRDVRGGGRDAPATKTRSRLRASRALWLAFWMVLAWVGMLSPLVAQIEQFGDFRYRHRDTYISIYGYTGAGGAITIPSTIAGLPVQRIGEAAFRNKTSVTSVTIPNSLTIIGERAFEGCIGLTSVTIPDSVTEIVESAFYGCTGLTSVSIPNSVTEIGEWAFSGCTGLTSVTIPDSITFIEVGMFSGCTGLTSFTIPNSVTAIGYGAFQDCTSLTSVTIPDSVTAIGIGGSMSFAQGRAFSGCTSLVSITIPKSVTAIENEAFKGCTSLTSTTFDGNAPTSFGRSVFSDTASNFTIYYHEGSTGFTSPTWQGYPAVALGAPATPPLETWRQQHFGAGATNTGEAADDADPDGDGFTNTEEFASGTDPKNALSALQMQSVTKTGATYTVTLDAQPGRRYVLQRLVPAAGATWQIVATQEPPTAVGPISLTDSAAPAGTALYRVQVTVP